MITPEDLQIQLQKVLEECASLREENERLKKLLGLFPEDIATTSKPNVSEPLIRYDTTCPPVTNDSPIEDQVTLFRPLFRGREDVYPIRWEGKKGNSGYSPACVHEWDRILCGKPKIKCADCENREFKPVTNQVILQHFIGKHTIGVYPLLIDETCCFVAVDFDKRSWQDDAVTFLKTCEEMGISAALERSRSGKGGHIWIFFDRPVHASLARKLGCAILTRTMERRIKSVWILTIVSFRVRIPCRRVDSETSSPFLYSTVPEKKGIACF